MEKKSVADSQVRGGEGGFEETQRGHYSTLTILGKPQLGFINHKRCDVHI